MSQWSCDIFQGQTLTLTIWNKGTDSFIQLINMNPLLQKRSINQQLLHGQLFGLFFFFFSFLFFPSSPPGAKGGEKVGHVSTEKWLGFFYRQTLPVGRKFSLAAVLRSMLLEVRRPGSVWGLPERNLVCYRRRCWVLSKERGRKGKLWQICVCPSGNKHILLDKWSGCDVCGDGSKTIYSLNSEFPVSKAFQVRARW